MSCANFSSFPLPAQTFKSPTEQRDNQSSKPQVGGTPELLGCQQWRLKGAGGEISQNLLACVHRSALNPHPLWQQWENKDQKQVQIFRKDHPSPLGHLWTFTLSAPPIQTHKNINERIAIPLGFWILSVSTRTPPPPARKLHTTAVF